MFIEKYLFENSEELPKWVFDEVKLRRRNLLVGKSGCGKSRFLNTIFNLGTVVFNEKNTLKEGCWDVTYNHSSLRFRYQLEVKSGSVMKERLEALSKDTDELLIDRSADSLKFKGMKLPKLTSKQAALTLLKEEDDIKMAHQAFGLIARRQFDADALDIVRILGNIPKPLMTKFESEGSHSFALFKQPLASRLYVIEKLDKQLYLQIRDMFMDVFPDFISWQIRKLKASEVSTELDGVMPGLFMTEKDVEGQISLADLSSGMQKVLLIITDVLSAPVDSVYLIDEYENSLGVNAIHFLPDLLVLADKLQTIVTTHHPYLINSMPIETWQILSRKGSTVRIISGESRKQIYGESKQETFTQLLNDPLYSSES